MIDSEFRVVFLPYCLQRIEGGAYAVLNRKYRPVGVLGSDTKLDAFAVRFKKELSAKQICELSWDGSSDAECIYLYADGCMPTRGQPEWDAYSKRIQLLAGLVIHA